jgi:hypothetical protein
MIATRNIPRSPLSNGEDASPEPTELIGYLWSYRATAPLSQSDLDWRSTYFIVSMVCGSRRR